MMVGWEWLVAGLLGLLGVLGWAGLGRGRRPAKVVAAEAVADERERVIDERESERLAEVAVRQEAADEARAAADAVDGSDAVAVAALMNEGAS